MVCKVEMKQRKESFPQDVKAGPEDTILLDIQVHHSTISLFPGSLRNEQNTFKTIIQVMLSQSI